MTTKEIIQKTAKAKTKARLYTTGQKNAALKYIAEEIEKAKDEILEANGKDCENANVSPVMLDRLSLNDKKIKSLTKGIEDVISLPDPNGKVLRSYKRGTLKIEKTASPLGLIGIIYESRPNVTSDVAALCIKSGNCVLLRCGKEAKDTSKEIVKAIKSGLKRAQMDEDIVNIVEDTSHDSVMEMMNAVGEIDLLIPRGGRALIDLCINNSKVPCIATGAGICHMYVDKDADIEMALKVVENAKCSRPSVCNALDVLLVSQDLSVEFLPKLYKRLYTNRDKNKVELRLCENSYAVLSGYEGVKKAGAEDFDTEFLDYVLSVKVVKDVYEACEHIALHSTGHSESIITDNFQTASVFTGLVDSAAVYVNASTRFTDGGEFGLGCEMGISTQKLHARGPMGLEELMTYKYIVRGNGEIRE